MSGVRGASSLGTIAAISVRDAAVAVQTVSVGQVRNAAGALKTFFSGLAATAAPDFVRTFGNSAAAIDITTPNVTATPAGGVAPFAYLWERTDAGGETWNITASTAATTAFECEAVASGASHSATFACTITDDTSAEVVTNEVTASVVNLGGGLML